MELAISAWLRWPWGQRKPMSMSALGIWVLSSEHLENRVAAFKRTPLLRGHKVHAVKQDEIGLQDSRI